MEKLKIKIKYEALKKISDLILNKKPEIQKKLFDKFYLELKENFNIFFNSKIVNLEFNKEFYYISGFIELENKIKNRFYYFHISDLREFEFEEISIKRVQYIGDFYLNSEFKKVNILKINEK